MRVLSLSLLLSLASVGCGGDDDEVSDGSVVRLDEASEEVVLTLKDLVERGEAITDDEVAAHLTAPADGEALPADEAPTFTWTLRDSNLRHGRETGEFVWLHIEGPGMEEPIDVAAIESTSWTVDDERWQALQASTGPCEVQVVSAYVDRGIVTEGPFVPAANPTFSVTE
jgi:hypothetical protein